MLHAFLFAFVQKTDSHDGTIWTFEASTKERRVNHPHPSSSPQSTDGEDVEGHLRFMQKKKKNSNCTRVSILKKKKKTLCLLGNGWLE